MPPTRGARAGSPAPAMGEKPGRGRKDGAWQGKAVHTTMKRVKVYRLKDNGKWDDQGTGHVTIDYIEGSRELVLAVVDEEDNDTLLLHKITPDDIYRKQEETIISWRDPEKSLELALSFQEAEGCSYIWENMSNIREDLQSKILRSHAAGPKPALKSLVPSSGSLLHDKSLSSVNAELKELPPLELSSLSAILKTILQCGMEEKMRVADLISKDRDFFPKIVNLFKTCKDTGDMDGLHMIFRLVNAIILLNSSAIFDKILSDDFILDIIGVLEYDPEVHIVQRHRAFLKDHAVLKKAIPIKNDSVVSKIHQTYRIHYIKDVILRKVLDDATLKSLNTIIHANNAFVVSFLKDDPYFIQDLFEKMRSNISAGSKSEPVFFLREFCTVSKSLQPAQQIQLSRDLADRGLFDIVSDMLRSQDKVFVSAGTDILLHFLNQDPNLLRSYIANHEESSGEDISLLGLLVKGIVTDFGGEMQFLEILRILLDGYSTDTATQCLQRSIMGLIDKKYFDKLIDIIESSCLPKSIDRSTFGSVGVGTRVEEYSAKPEILLHICEFLCFCVVHHPYRMKVNFLKSNSMEKILSLTHRRERFLVVAAVRFMRTVIGTNDELLISHVIKLKMLKPIIEAFVENGNRDNLLQSTILELLEYIRKENKKSLVLYVVESFWNQLVKFGHLGSIQAFRLKYQEFVDRAETEETTGVGHMRKKAEERGLDKEEEDYFNTDSNEEDSSVETTQAQQQWVKPGDRSETHHIPARPKSSGLVDHDGDKDYNPPPKRPVEADEALNIPMARHRSLDGKVKDGNVRKKPRLEGTIRFSKINVLANVADKHLDLEDAQPPLSPASSTINSNGNVGVREASPGSPNQQPPESFDYIAGDSSSEMVVDAAEAADSDP